MTRSELPRVAVLLATYNGAAHVTDQVASIAAQDGVAVDLFVRDDGSHDGTVETTLAAAAKARIEPHVLTHDAERLGSATANFFEMLSRIDIPAFDFIAFADQDDVWLSDKLGSACEILARTGADGYSSNLVAFENAGHKSWIIRKDQPQRRFDYLFQGASAGCTYVLTRPAAKMIAASLSKPGFVLPSWASHDWFIYAACRAAGMKWQMDARARIRYRQHAANAFGAMPGFGGLRQRLRLSRSGWYRQHILWLGETLDLSPDARRVIDAVERFSVADRAWLVRHVGEFRRSPRDRYLLALSIAAGLI